MPRYVACPAPPIRVRTRFHRDRSNRRERVCDPLWGVLDDLPASCVTRKDRLGKGRRARHDGPLETGERGGRHEVGPIILDRSSLQAKAVWLDDAQRRGMCRIEDGWRSDSSFVGLFPSRRAQAPTVAGYEARKPVLGVWRAEVVSAVFGERQKRFGHLCTHDVNTAVLGPGVARAVPGPPRHRVGGTARERSATHVESVSGGARRLQRARVFVRSETQTCRRRRGRGRHRRRRLRGGSRLGRVAGSEGQREREDRSAHRGGLARRTMGARGSTLRRW